jgi:uracil-DNA glycosylase
MSFPWSSKLDFFHSGECQVMMEKLDDLEKAGVRYTPARKDLFKALSAVEFNNVRCVIVGQDPYPDPRYATGLAFSIPADVKSFPPTLRNILQEYHDDLGYPLPTSGNLQKWVDQGVLLWNAIPICVDGKPLAVEGWFENHWPMLTREIITKLSARACVFAFLGGYARQFAKYVDPAYAKPHSNVIETSHPSPRGSLNSFSPFKGSRLFSTINAKLREQGFETIDWRL